jgi:hypothetical protein
METIMSDKSIFDITINDITSTISDVCDSVCNTSLRDVQEEISSWFDDEVVVVEDTAKQQVQQELWNELLEDKELLSKLVDGVTKPHVLVNSLFKK